MSSVLNMHTNDTVAPLVTVPLVKLALILIMAQVVTSQTFKVSVVEYQEDYSHYYNPTNHKAKNSEDYVHLISEVAYEGSGLIVFPENSFAYHDVFSTSEQQTARYAFRIPSPELDINLCTLPEPNKYGKFLAKISCVAREKEIYVVMNLLEETEDSIYSTNIVFDKKGKIIAKCRKDIYTGKQLKHNICSFIAKNYEFVMIMENDLFSPDIHELIGDAKNVIYTAHRALKNTVFPSAPLYEMMRNKYNLENLLVSAKHDSAYGLTGSGIFTPFQSNIIQAEMIEKSQIISDHLGFKSSSNRKFRYLRNGANHLSTYIKSVESMEIKELKTGKHEYCSDEGLCCTITTLPNYEPKDFKVGIFNITKDVSRKPKYDELQERTTHQLKFCGIIHCEKDNCTTLLERSLETPQVRIEIAEVEKMSPLIVGRDLTYEKPETPAHPTTTFENFNTYGYIFGFIKEEVRYEKISQPKEEIFPIRSERHSGGNNVQGNSCFAFLMICLCVFNSLYFHDWRLYNVYNGA